MRLLTLLFFYGGLALGGLWLAQDPGRLNGMLATWTGPSAQALPEDPETIRRIAERDLRANAENTARKALPPPGSYLDEDGMPRLDPASLKRFLEEAAHLQERIDQHRRVLDEKIRAATR